ncbi:MAG: hypothetical protein HBSAPP03_13160 [Phycisphaerae bacterium]|nr:MAG: hypothetical protein HBSAPP03_13160 [Phycisphaerae bacterium]
MPVHDWQFWVVSLAAVLALAYLLREVLPAKWSPFRRKPRGKPTTLTVKGKARE